MSEFENWEAERVPEKEGWTPRIPDKVFEDAKYFRKCPTCSGYLERRGDFYTCQGCPMEIPAGGERTATIPVFSLRSSEFLRYSDDEMAGYLDEQATSGQPLYVALRRPASLELRGGKIPIPGAVPYDVSSEGVPLYKYMELGWNPDTQQREKSHPELTQSAPEQRGTYATFPKNKRGEVRDYDHSLGWAMVHIPLNYPQGHDARYHPHAGVGFVPYADLQPIRPKKSPFRGPR